MKSSRLILVVLAFFAIYTIWGSTYLAISYAIDTIPPFMMAGGRFMAAALLLFAWILYKRIPLPSKKEITAASVSGILMFVGGNVSVVWAEKYISSGVAAIIIATMPIWFVLLDAEQLKKLRGNYFLGAGVLLGLAGVLIIVDVQSLTKTDITINHLISYGLLILSSITWTIGTLYTRKASHPKNVSTKIMVQLMASGILTLLISVFVGEFNGFESSSVNTLSLLSWAYLVVFGTLIAYYSYIWLIQIKPATLVGTYTYVNPVIAVLLGWWLREEIVSANIVTGLVTILISIFLINFSFYRFGKKQNTVKLAKP